MAEFTDGQARQARAVLPAEVLQRCMEQLAACILKFRQKPVTPLSAYEFEKELRGVCDQLGRHVLEIEFNRLEPDSKPEATPRVRYHRESYRINKKTPQQVATSLGVITVRSYLYLCDEAGEPGLHPLHVRLGIAAGAASSVLAERVARWAVDFSQREVRHWLLSEHSLCWSNDRLRQVLRAFRREAVAFQHQAQVQRVLHWLHQAAASRGRHRPVLAAGRDGIMVPLRIGGYQEASTATVAVYDRRRKRLGTVYLGQMPESGQATLSRQLTTVLLEVLRGWQGPAPRLAFISDKGDAPEKYFRQVLRRMKDPHHPKRRLQWQWILDFFHVCSYLGKLRETLFGKRGYPWYERMRHWLRHRDGGVANILRSAVQHYNQRPMSAAAQEEFWTAYRYLRRHQRHLHYAAYRRHGLPIGSGVTEAACKTLFTQRLKRSGMRWHKDSGQVIVDLRVLYLSGIWGNVVHQDLASRPLPIEVSSRPTKQKTAKIAA
jgi:hypothetical protein